MSGAPPSHLAVELPVGHTDRSGRVHRTALLRKVTGREEELLYAGGLNGGQLVTMLLAACITRLGTLERVDRELVADLFVADRNQLLLDLRRHTLGPILRTWGWGGSFSRSILLVIHLVGKSGRQRRVLGSGAFFQSSV